MLVDLRLLTLALLTEKLPYICAQGLQGSGGILIIAGRSECKVSQ